MNLIFEHGIWSFANAEIWVGIGLIIFFGILIAAGVPKMAGKALDAKAVKIQADLDEAARLRAEAEALLAQIRKEKAEAEAQAAEMMAQAEADARRLEVEGFAGKPGQPVFAPIAEQPGGGVGPKGSVGR